MVHIFIIKKNQIFDKDSTGSQDEGEKQIDVDVVPGAVKLPAKTKIKSCLKHFVFPHSMSVHNLRQQKIGNRYLKAVKTKIAVISEMSEVA